MKSFVADFGEAIMKENKKVLLKELIEIYEPLKSDIEKRLEEFKQIWEKATDKDLFIELVFCLLTPQSKAKVCGIALEQLVRTDLLFNGTKDEITGNLNAVRFKKNKADNIILARDKFLENGNFSLRHTLSDFQNDFERREWLVKNVRGMAYKEASHYLRNIGFWENLAILDRHILRNLDKLDVIKEIPKTITKKRYFEIENKMRNLADEIGMPIAHLDLLLWYKETGEIYK